MDALAQTGSGWWTHEGGADPLGELVRLPDVFEAVEAARGAVDALLREPRLRRRHDPR